MGNLIFAAAGVMRLLNREAAVPREKGVWKNGGIRRGKKFMTFLTVEHQLENVLMDLSV